MFERTVTTLDSSFIDCIEYDVENQVMRVHFITGSIWDYQDVPPVIFGSLACAQSVGSVFNELVRDRYNGELLKLEMIRKLPAKKQATQPALANKA